MRIILIGAMAALLVSLVTRPASAVCGDTFLEAGEACDDGNLDAGDCCSPSCEIEADDDDDRLCDTRDDCPASAQGAFVRGRLLVRKLGVPLGDERVQIKAEFALAQVFDPAATGMRVVVHDSTGTIIMDAPIPPGTFDGTTRMGWRTNGRLIVWRGNGMFDRATLKPLGEQPGMMRLLAVGRDATALMPVDAPITVTVIPAASGAPGDCAQISFAGESGVGRCALLNGRQRLACR